MIVQEDLDLLNIEEFTVVSIKKDMRIDKALIGLAN